MIRDWPRSKGNGEEGDNEGDTRKEESRGLGERILERQEERNRGLGEDNCSFLQFIQQTFEQPCVPDPGNEGLAVQHTLGIRVLMELPASGELSWGYHASQQQAVQNCPEGPGYMTERTQPHSKEMGKSRGGEITNFHFKRLSGCELSK